LIFLAVVLWKYRGAGVGLALLPPLVGFLDEGLVGLVICEYKFCGFVSFFHLCKFSAQTFHPLYASSMRAVPLVSIIFRVFGDVLTTIAVK
jgi:hypothetical protein